jgi:hypothetical protein
LELNELKPRARANISGFLRENRQFEITAANLGDLMKLAQPTVAEKADKLMAFLSRRFPSPGDSFEINSNAYPSPLAFFDAAGRSHDMAVADFHFELVAVAWAIDGGELTYLVNDYLTKAKGWLTCRSGFQFVISAAGWAFLETMRPNRASPFGFVAMNFKKELLGFYEQGLKPGIERAGYSALRIDRHEHVNRIDDEIIAQLRKSRFCVADFTGQNQGVYFEAGFALGFNLPVVWTCAADELKSVHFDTRQYNALRWEADALPDFTTRLANRIEAIIGKFPKPTLSVG